MCQNLSPPSDNAEAGLHGLMMGEPIVPNAEQWNAFVALLNVPAKDNPGLQDLLALKPVWEA